MWIYDFKLKRVLYSDKSKIKWNYYVYKSTNCKKGPLKGKKRLQEVRVVQKNVDKYTELFK